MSHPSRGAWIEILDIHNITRDDGRRTPHGVRGLKSPNTKKILNKEKFDRPSTDVLMEGGLKKDPHFDEIRAAMQAAVPSEQPPVYDLLEQENAERMAAEEDSSPTDLVGYEKPPVDTGVQWVLELVPQEGRVIQYGGGKGKG